jgi:hypothetical protein
VPFKLRQELSGLPLQGGNEFGSHEVILKCHLLSCKCCEPQRIGIRSRLRDLGLKLWLAPILELRRTHNKGKLRQKSQ